MTSELPGAVSLVRCALGEGPLWHPAEQRLFVTDIDEGQVFAFEPGLRTLETIELKRTTSALTWQLDGSLLFFHDRCAISRRSARFGIEVLMAGIPGEEAGRFNDVIADSHGRVLAGAEPVASRGGRLYSVERDLTCRVLLSDLGEPNGMAFSPDGSALYLCDSIAGTITKFSYDARTGSLGAHETIFETHEALPDGLTVDSDGYLWCALWDGGAVLRLAPDGTVVRTINLPVARPTSVAFGGADLGTLYVTSAREGSAQSIDSSSLDGAVFALDVAARGRTEYPSRLG
jgi:D-xylonolactonase